MRTADWSASISVLDRITAVFDAFGPHDEGLGVSELARRAHLPKSTVSRVAAELVEQRFLERQGDKLFLGMRLYELGQNVEEPRRLRRLALPIMAELRDLTGRTVALALPQRAEVLVIAVIRGSSEATGVAVGARLPAADSTLGRALLAPSSPTGGARMPGVVVLTDERGTGFTHLAACVVDGGAPVAALSLSAPDGEIDPGAQTSVLQRAALALGHRVTASRSH